MMNIKEYTRRSLLTALAVSQFLFFPAYSSRPVVAQESGNDDTTQTEQTSEGTEGTTTEPVVPEVPPEPPKAGHPPNGADSRVFEYDYDTDTWESFLYSYEPVSRVRTMKNVPTVRYNYDTGLWEKLGYTFSAPSQTYIPYVMSTHTSQPSGVVTGSVPQSSSYGGSNGGSGGNGGTSINGTGPNSNTGVQNQTNNSADIDINNNADFSVILDLLAQSGNASVLGNTTGGSAATGGADSTANVLNQIQSTWDINDILTFSSDLYGDIYGDLLVDTSNIGPHADVAVNNEINNDLDIDVNNDTTIVNDIDVVAGTGDATVSGNTEGGDATSGDANALVNIINMINSSIDSGANFMGTLNIHGNFDGDILFPQGALETLISDTGPESNVETNNAVNNDLDIEINNNTAVANNINATAATGDATVSGNTHGGDATSGDATSSVTMLNLTGKQVVSENTLLVFINVLGEWVGVLMDAPAGTTAAAIGGGANVLSDTAVNNSIDYTENNNASITNNVNAHAESGDATVSGNTYGGDATSGDANAAVNIANLVGSDITSNSWFGVLFINVFGTWAGSFGVDTAAGDHLNNSGSGVAGATTGQGGQGGEGPQSAPAVAGSDVKVYGFAQTSDGGHRAVALASNGGGQGGDTGNTLGASDSSSPFVLGDSTAGGASGALEDTGNSQSSAITVGLTVLALTALVMFGNRMLAFATASSRRR